MRMVGRLLALLRCSHPAAATAVTLGCGILALVAGRGLGTFVVVAATLSGQLFVGWSNDYLDHESDVLAARTDKPVATGEVKATTVAKAAVVALLFCVPLSLASSLLGGLAYLGWVALATLYNLRLKATALSVLPYAAAFALLPAFITLGLPMHPLPPYWATLAGGLIGAGAHFTQALPDIETDLREGVRGLPQLIGPRWSVAAASLLLGAAAITVTLGPGTPSIASLVGLVATLAVVVAVLVVGLSGHARIAFRLTLVVAMLVVVALILSGRGLMQQ